MLISDQKRFIFVHIYKTGGSSITRLLGPHVEERYRSKSPRTDDAGGWQGTWHYRGRQHAKLADLVADPEWQGRDLAAYRICAFVRNPYSWTLSVWNDFYRREEDAPDWFTGRDPQRGFGEFCRSIRDARAGRQEQFWGSEPQSSFIAHPVLKPTFLGRFERLREDAARLLALLGIAANTLPHDVQNRPAERARYLSFYDAESLSIVSETFAADFETFGYEVIRSA